MAHGHAGEGFLQLLFCISTYYPPGSRYTWAGTMASDAFRLSHSSETCIPSKWIWVTVQRELGGDVQRLSESELEMMAMMVIDCSATTKGDWMAGWPTD